MDKDDFDAIELKDRTESKMVAPEIEDKIEVSDDLVQRRMNEIEELNRLTSNEGTLVSEGNEIAEKDFLDAIDDDIRAQANKNLFELYKKNLLIFTAAIMITIPGSCIHYIWAALKLDTKRTGDFTDNKSVSSVDYKIMNQFDGDSSLYRKALGMNIAYVILAIMLSILNFII